MPGRTSHPVWIHGSPSLNSYCIQMNLPKPLLSYWFWQIECVNYALMLSNTQKLNCIIFENLTSKIQFKSEATYYFHITEIFRHFDIFHNFGAQTKREDEPSNQFHKRRRSREGGQIRRPHPPEQRCQCPTGAHPGTLQACRCRRNPGYTHTPPPHRRACPLHRC